MYVHISWCVYDTYDSICTWGWWGSIVSKHVTIPSKRVKAVQSSHKMTRRKWLKEHIELPKKLKEYFKLPWKYGFRSRFLNAQATKTRKSPTITVFMSYHIWELLAMGIRRPICSLGVPDRDTTTMNPRICETNGYRVILRKIMGTLSQVPITISLILVTFIFVPCPLVVWVMREAIHIQHIIIKRSLSYLCRS